MSQSQISLIIAEVDRFNADQLIDACTRAGIKQISISYHGDDTSVIADKPVIDWQNMPCDLTQITLKKKIAVSKSGTTAEQRNNPAFNAYSVHEMDVPLKIAISDFFNESSDDYGISERNIRGTFVIRVQDREIDVENTFLQIQTRRLRDKI